jgi:hypothetical protein
VQIAASDQASDHEELLGLLNSRGFLHRLNTEREYDVSRPKQLRVAKVLRTLHDNPSPFGKQTLTGLAKGGDFVGENWLRQELLVRVLVDHRPPPPEVIQFWDRQSQVESENRHITIDVLCENGTEEAMVLLEKRLLDPAHEREYKIAWIRDCMLRHRNDTPLLEASERMLKGALDADLKLILLEALCTYSADWYPSCSKPKPPARLRASEASRVVLRRICRFAREKLPLTVAIEVAVRTTEAELGQEEKEKPGQ